MISERLDSSQAELSEKARQIERLEDELVGVKNELMLQNQELALAKAEVVAARAEAAIRPLLVDAQAQVRSFLSDASSSEKQWPLNLPVDY